MELWRVNIVQAVCSRKLAVASASNTSNITEQCKLLSSIPESRLKNGHIRSSAFVHFPPLLYTSLSSIVKPSIHQFRL